MINLRLIEVFLLTFIILLPLVLNSYLQVSHFDSSEFLVSDIYRENA